MGIGNNWIGKKKKKNKWILICLVSKYTYMYVYSTHEETREMCWRKLSTWEGLWGVVMLTEQCTLKPATRLAYMSDIHINQPVHCTSRGGGEGGVKILQLVHVQHLDKILNSICESRIQTKAKTTPPRQIQQKQLFPPQGILREARTCTLEHNFYFTV